MPIQDSKSLQGNLSGAPLYFASTARAARHAAREWFRTPTTLSAAQFRDVQFQEHCRGRVDTPFERRIRHTAFNEAYAAAIGQIVVEEGRLHALPA